MKTGDILLVHSESKLAKIIQKFQMKKDPKAGYWNHSGIIEVAAWGVYVREMAEAPGRKVWASTVCTPIEDYINSERELLLLTPKVEIDEDGYNNFMRIVYKYTGTPYDYGNLAFHQIVRLLTGKWIGKKKAEASKSMVCHEYVQKIWDEYAGIFPEWNRAKVSNIYHSKYFIKIPIK